MYYKRQIEFKVSFVCVLRPWHLCFKQAQPKMYHSPKVDDGVDIFFKSS